MTRSNAPSMRPVAPATYTHDGEVWVGTGRQGQGNGPASPNARPLAPRGALGSLPVINRTQGIRHPVATAPARSPILDLTRSIEQHVKVATCEEALDTAAFIDGLPDGPNRAAHLDVFRHALERNVEQRVKVATREEMLGTAVFIRRLPDIPAKAAHQDEFCRALEQSVSQIGSPATDRDPSAAFLDAASAFNFPDGSLPPRYKARLVNAFADRIGSLSNNLQAGAFDELCNITGHLNPSDLQIEPLDALIKQIKLPAVYGQAQQAINSVAAIVVN